MKDKITHNDKTVTPKVRRTGCLSRLGIIILPIGIALSAVLCISASLSINNYRVVGPAMESNLRDGQFLFIEKLSYSRFMLGTLNAGGPARGDVIMFEHPNHREQHHILRIIGLSGETIDMRGGQVLINNQRFDEPFRPITDTYNLDSSIVVPTGHVFVLGDNRGNANDSRHWGTLPIENIIGRAWLIYWPPSEWGKTP